MAETSEPPKGTSEISEVPDKSKQPSSPANHFDPKIMRKTKPGLKRLVLTLSVLFSFILGFPFLWKSVEIYRASLPFRDIDSLSSRIESETPLSFPCHFQAIFIGFDPKTVNPDQAKTSIMNSMNKMDSKNPQCGSCSRNFTLSVAIDSDSDCLKSQKSGASSLYSCGSLKGIGFGGGGDEGVDELLEAALGFGGKVYSVVVVKRDEEVRAVVGKYRHAWVAGKISVEEAVPRVAEIFLKVFANGGKEEWLTHAEFMPVGADGRIVFSFNLLNADPHDWIYDWDFQGIDETRLAPIIKALGPIANATVESQVLYHTPKSALSYWDETLKSYIFTAKDLPFFVNSNEWHLDTSVAAGGRSKILQFVVYIPSAKECPLLLQLPDGKISKTNGFISPMWGGIVVWNPRGCSKESESGQNIRHRLSPQDMQEVLEVFMGQIRQLFGLKSDDVYAGESDSFTFLPSEKGFTEWELDVLFRKHACFNLHSTASTLGSLSKLVQSLPRMIIMDEIGKQVEFSLEAAKSAERNVCVGIDSASAVSLRQARSLAEDAFFHPSIMSVSYFSFEHCFAVYSPFFLPVSLHVLLAAIKEWRRYKQEKAKYLNWKAKVKTE